MSNKWCISWQKSCDVINVSIIVMVAIYVIYKCSRGLRTRALNIMISAVRALN
jgi:uncharacterized CHY-type Zn-finger protein